MLYSFVKNEANRALALENEAKYGLFSFSGSLLGEYSIISVTINADGLYNAFYMSKIELCGEFFDCVCGHRIKIDGENIILDDGGHVLTNKENFVRSIKELSNT